MRWLDNPPGLIFHSLWLLGLGIVLLDASVPAGLRRPSLLGAFWLFALLVVWCLRGPAFTIRMRTRPGQVRRRRRWVYAPLSLVVVVLLASSSWPLHLRFSLSRPMLSRAAEEVAGGADGDPRLVGLYLIDGMERVGTAVVFTERTGGFIFDRGGFAYIPDDPNDPALDSVAPRCEMWSLGNDWYAWHGSWYGGSSLHGCGLDGPSRH